jgi:hypothetical protein
MVRAIEPDFSMVRHIGFESSRYKMHGKSGLSGGWNC